MSKTAYARQGKTLPMTITPETYLSKTLAALSHLRRADREFLRDAMTLYGNLRVRELLTEIGE